MGSRKLLALVLWLLLLVFLVLLGEAQGSSSRYSHRFKVHPKSHHNSPRSIVGALPKGMPIPPSAPSKKHNGIGLQGSRTFP
ncbi:hypothetical protein PTKIN_Ptkin01aG0009100 [Pterospermum kingtungense]